MAKKSVKARPLTKIRSLAGLRQLCSCPPTPFDVSDRYRRLAMIAAENLGGPCDDYKEALQTLEQNAMEVTKEYNELHADMDLVDGEQLIVDEINFVRDIEAEEFMTRR